MEEFHVISLGMGTQSSALLIDALEGRFDFTPDLAVFSDLQGEPENVYQFADQLRSYCLEKYGFEILILNAGDYLQDIVDFLHGSAKRVATPPMFVDNGRGKAGKVMRQCTDEYKIRKIRRISRAAMKEAGKKKMAMHMGITMDEADRAADIKYKRDGSQVSPAYIRYSFPYIEQLQKRRDHCIDMLRDLGMNPVKSSCKFCPYHSDKFWQDMKTNYPEEFQQCCEVDELIRDWPKLKGKAYLHRSLKPLSQVVFDKGHDLFSVASGNCHSGICGV